MYVETVYLRFEVVLYVTVMYMFEGSGEKPVSTVTG